MNAKKWLQTIGIVLMISAFVDGRPISFHFYKWELILGALIFGCTFLTWKRNGKGDT